MPEIKATKEKAFVPPPTATKPASGDARPAAATPEKSSFIGQLLYGFALGLTGYIVYLKRAKILALFGK